MWLVSWQNSEKRKTTRSKQIHVREKWHRILYQLPNSFVHHVWQITADKRKRQQFPRRHLLLLLPRFWVSRCCHSSSKRTHKPGDADICFLFSDRPEFISSFTFLLHSVLRCGASECEGGVWCLSAGWRRPGSLPPVFGMFSHTLPLSKVSQHREDGRLALFVCFQKKTVSMRLYRLTQTLSSLEDNNSPELCCC